MIKIVCDDAFCFAFRFDLHFIDFAHMQMPYEHITLHSIEDLCFNLCILNFIKVHRVEHTHAWISEKTK